MSDQTRLNTIPTLSLRHVTTTTTVFIGITEVAFREPADPVMGGRTDTSSALYHPVRVDNHAQFKLRFGNFLEDAFLPDAVNGYFANGGAPCYVVSIKSLSDGDDQLPTVEACIKGLKALENLDETYLLICPDLVTGSDGEPIALADIKHVQKAMIAHCEQKRGCFAILDALPNLNAIEVLEYRRSLNFNSTAAALYYPWLTVPDLSDSPNISKAAPPSGHVAGIFHRVQQQYGRVLAPANEIVRGAIDLEIYITRGEETVLLPHQINCIRAFSGRGIRLWGARTLRDDFIVVGDQTSTTPQTEGPESRMAPIKLLDTSISAFLGITEQATRYEKDYFSNEMIPKESFLNRPVFVNSWQAYTALFGDFVDDAYLPNAVYGFFANGGQYCYIVSLQSVKESDSYPLPPLTASDYIGDPVSRTGLASLEAFDDVHLIVCPDLMFHYDGSDAAKQKIKEVQTAVIAHCEWQERIAILDVPPGLNPQQVKEWRFGVNFDTAYAVMYYPWIDILNQAGRRKRMPASGHIAGIYQRQSQQYGHHKPPANAQIYGAVNLEHELTDGEQAVLTPIGINVLRAFPGRGIRPWGARTLSSDGFYRYIHTRRMLSMIKSAINDGTSWVQFELHDPALLVRVHKQINDFLEMLRLKGMLVGDTPEEAYFVQCDEDLNPPQKQKQGELTAMIAIALLQPANFYQFYVRQANSARKMVAEINY